MGAVPALDEGNAQLNARFPKRDKKSDGLWGDAAHRRTKSSHNGDKSGTPEWRDGDDKDEVRARDWDKDLKDPNTTMEQVVQEWVRLCRAGKMPWIRYIIFNKRIWHIRDNFKTHVYVGKNQHTEHVHVNTEFTQKADNTKGTNWGLKNFRKNPTTKPKPMVKVLKKGDNGQDVIHLQDFFRRVFPTYRLGVSVKRGQVLGIDGDFGDQTEAWVKEFQERTGLKQDGEVGPKTLAKLRDFGYRF